jgi:hypothetical protein
MRGVWWRRGRVELPLKHGLAVWVIDNWPAVALDDGKANDRSPMESFQLEREELEPVGA